MKKTEFIIIGIFAGIILSTFIFAYYFQSHRKSISQEIQTIKQEQRVQAQFANLIAPPLSAAATDFTEAAEKTVNAVVHVKTEIQRQSSFYDFFNEFHELFDERGYGSPQPKTVTGTGSGVIISRDGYIITNNHVVDKALNIQIILNDKRTYNAEVVGTDPSTDIALLKIKETNLPFLSYGNSDQVKIGEWVLAVGNPFNLTSTVTAGIVSAKARNINILGARNSIETFIQTDAAVNRGNSGGALVNTNGDLVGINAAIASGTGYYAGYSFAIPVNIVKRVVKDILEYGKPQRAYIGVQIRDLTTELANENGIDNINGVYVSAVTENGSAQKAGIESGDVITEINGKKVNTNSELIGIVGQHRPGDMINLTINRNNELYSFDVKLRNEYGDTFINTERTSELSLLGATFGEISDDQLNKLGIDHGIKINKLRTGKFKEAGMKEGFIITKIDYKKIYSLIDIETSLKNKQGGILVEGLYPNGAKAYYGFGM